MIPIEEIKSRRILITHGYPEGPCPDGLAAALIIRDALPSIDVRFLVHNTMELENLKAEPGMLFVDICPPRARAQEFIDAGAIVLDHHAATRDVVEAFGERGVYADAATEPGVSGAVLAFREVWRVVDEDQGIDTFFPASSRRPNERVFDRISRFAMLAGVRDTWQKRSPHWKEACEQAASLLFWPGCRDFTRHGREALRGSDFESWMAIGPVLLAKAEEKARRLALQHWALTTDHDTHVAVLPSCEISDAADLMGGFDVVVGFQFTASETEPPAMRVSLRARGRHDVSQLASRFGGGGHKGAAGFRLSLASHLDRADPYTMLRGIITAYEHKDEAPWGLTRAELCEANTDVDGGGSKRQGEGR